MVRAIRIALKGFALGVCDDAVEIGGRLHAETSGPSLRAEASLHAPAHFVMWDGFATIERSQPFGDLLPEPRVVLEVTGDEFLHYLLFSLTRLRGKLV